MFGAERLAIARRGGRCARRAGSPAPSGFFAWAALIAGSDHRITAPPWPGSRMDRQPRYPEPPPETFRQWWRAPTTGGPRHDPDARRVVLDGSARPWSPRRLRPGRGPRDIRPVPRPGLATPSGSRASGANTAHGCSTSRPRGSAATVAGLLAPGARVVIPPGLPADWVTWGLDVAADSSRKPLRVTELDRAHAVVTGCAVGIAATGDHRARRRDRAGRRALTLVPDHHICVMFTDQIVDTVP